MKVGKNIVTAKLGSGCSRKAVLLDNGMVCKLPRYKSSWNHLGRPDGVVVMDLLREFQNDEAVVKINKLKAKGFELPAPCKGTLTEYLFSLKIKDLPEAKYFAKCIEIKVRKKRNENAIDIKGFYEDANEMKEGTYSHWSDLNDLPYEVEDIHSGNIVNQYIVDYAALNEK